LAALSRKKQVWALAKAVAQWKGAKIDRLAKRTKEGLLCWLCEYAPELAWGVPIPAIPAIPEIPAIPAIPAVPAIPPVAAPQPPAEQPQTLDWAQIFGDVAAFQDEEEVMLRGLDF
jgi:hypothetical protein